MCYYPHKKQIEGNVISTHAKRVRYLPEQGMLFKKMTALAHASTNMDPQLRNILDTVATDSIGDSHTHVSLYGPHARWTIPRQNKTLFWTSYCDLIDRNNDEQGAKLCLAERPQEVMPVIAKLTLRFI